MTDSHLFFDQAPPITDQAANDICELLYQLSSAFENHYFAQLKRFDQEREDEWRELMELQHQQQDLFTDFDDDLDF